MWYPEWPAHLIYQWCGHTWTRRCCRQCDNLCAARHMFPSSGTSNLQVVLQTAHAIGLPMSPGSWQVPMGLGPLCAGTQRLKNLPDTGVKCGSCPIIRVYPIPTKDPHECCSSMTTGLLSLTCRRTIPLLFARCPSVASGLPPLARHPSHPMPR